VPVQPSHVGARSVLQATIGVMHDTQRIRAKAAVGRVSAGPKGIDQCFRPLLGDRQ